MTEVIKVFKHDTRTDEYSIQDYVDVLNGIVQACIKGSWCSGYRNEIIVDLVVSSYMLGLDPTYVITQMIEKDLIDPRNDDESTMGRVERVLEYDDRFCWDWMLDPDTYVDLSKDLRSGDAPLSFVVVD